VRGIPYRGGYLLYRPPGTGKSSLSLSIAGECYLDIYILNISSVDEDSLRGLFAELPARCVVLLEDIDTVSATHSRQHGRVTAGQDATTSSTKEKPEGKVSLSALQTLSMALLRRKDGTECMLRHLACKVCRQLLELCLLFYFQLLELRFV
jgi:hypothetical protein